MASPLLDYANSRVFITSEGGISTVNGRIIAAESTKYVVNCFMKRAQYTGVTSGGKRVPLESQLGGQMMPGASGDSFYYRGYGLQYAVVTTQNWATDPLTAFSWTDVGQQYTWMKPGIEVQFKFGNDQTLIGQIERSSGVFGGVGIDEIIYQEIGGVELQIIGAELLN